MTESTSFDESKDIVIERIFNAPRHLVWAAFTEPSHIEKWFGPEGFSTRVEQLDFDSGWEIEVRHDWPRRNRIPVSRCVS